MDETMSTYRHAETVKTNVRRRLDRRRLLAALGTSLGGVIAACSGSAASPSSTTTPSASSGTSSAACTVAAEETAGPYPDRLGMVNNAAFFRRDITEGRTGTPLNLTLTIVNTKASCAPLASVSVEIWQCDASGAYSEYSQPGYDGTGQTFLRGLQVTDVNGQVAFSTIYPGWYQGRATHVHVQVFRGGSLVKTTQIAFPESVSAAVYATGVYAAKGQNPTSNATDNVFADGTSTEMANVAGGAGGYSAALTIGVAV
jgi:protocatechuate 3,4-dioxygenase beta subunit